MPERAERWVLGVLIAVIAIQLAIARSEASRLAKLTAELTTRTLGENVLQAGDAVPALEGVNARNELIRPELAGAFLVITVDRDCLGTRRNNGQWASILQGASRLGVDVVFLTPDTAAEAEGYLRELGLTPMVLGRVPYAVHTAFGLSVVPQVVLVRDGRVRDAWHGIVSSREIVGVMEEMRAMKSKGPRDSEKENR